MMTNSGRRPPPPPVSIPFCNYPMCVEEQVLLPYSRTYPDAAAMQSAAARLAVFGSTKHLSYRT